jgi:3' terminal RNA ribose 2'-O-methyltransferase Hen1
MAKIAVLPCRGGEEFLRRLFEPLGYDVSVINYPLDEKFPEWGESSYFTVTFRGTLPLRGLLTHLYVLIPVMDNDKHYWVGDDEVAKLLRHGEDWLPTHPDRELITRRYLKHHRNLLDNALSRLTDDHNIDPDRSEKLHAEEEAQVEERILLNDQRLGAVAATLKNSGAKRVLDLGCALHWGHGARVALWSHLNLLTFSITPIRTKPRNATSKHSSLAASMSKKY